MTFHCLRPRRWLRRFCDPERNSREISKGTAVKFVILLGLVSLFADITYEGARSIAGPFLAILGASGMAVGVVAGLGELIGYGLRLVSGYLSDRTGRYWAFTLIGYSVNLLAVPLLALAGSWEVAALLMVAERVGKAIRIPSRDAMLSHATQRIGRGWGFGLHEAMDQIGAILGPLIISIVLYLSGGYRAGFAILLIPALLALIVLIVGWTFYPRPRDLEVGSAELGRKGFSRIFWLYLSAVCFIGAGYVDFPLISFHFKKLSVVPEVWISVFYAVAMGMDAISALFFGRLFDRIGLPILIVASLLSSLFAPLVFLGEFHLALFGMALWGVGMGAQESIMRAAISEMVPMEKRSTAYGIFNAGFGLFWFLGSALMGILYDFSISFLIVFSVAMQLASLPLFVSIWRRKGDS